MKEFILIKNGEIVLKGLNKGRFEDALIKNARRRLEPLGRFTFRKAQSTIYVIPPEGEVDLDEAVARLQTGFGIARLCRARVVEKDFEDIKAKAVERAYMTYVLADASKFGKVAAVTVCGLEKACILTDRLPDESYRQYATIKEVE